eukprot:155014-Rhodomonas_salina.4
MPGTATSTGCPVLMAGMVLHHWYGMPGTESAHAVPARVPLGPDRAVQPLRPSDACGHARVSGTHPLARGRVTWKGSHTRVTCQAHLR